MCNFGILPLLGGISGYLFIIIMIISMSNAEEVEGERAGFYYVTSYIETF